MSDIQDPIMNRISSLEQVQQLQAPTSVQENQKLGMYLDNVLGADGQAARGGISLDAVMSGSLNGYMGLGDNALDGLGGSLASAEILNRPQSMAMAPPPPPPLDMKISETLASLDNQEVSEMALGLVPGVTFDMALASRPSPVAVAEVMKSNETESPALKLEQKQAMGDIETLAHWETNINEEMAFLENIPTAVTGTLAMAEPQKNDIALNVKAQEKAGTDELAMNLKANEAFDVRPFVGKPVIEGTRENYSSMFSQIHETLSRYDGDGSQGLLGMTELLGEPLGTQSLGFDQTAPVSPLGLRQVPASQLMGHHAVINNELFGFLDLSSYSQSAGMGVNPTAATTLLKPAKYVSNLVNGYYI